MPRSSILSLVLLPLILATAVFVWTPGIVVRAEASSGEANPAAFDRPAPDVLADDHDVATVDVLLDAFHALREGPAGAERDWERFLGLFHPEHARLFPITAPTAGARASDVWNPARFVEHVAQTLDDEGLVERELERKIDWHEGLAQVWSRYEARRSPLDEQPFERGVRSFQLVDDGTRWWIVSIAWLNESPDTLRSTPTDQG